MKNYILTFVLAVFVVLVAFSLKQKLTSATPAQGNTQVMALGSFPPPLPPAVNLGSFPPPLPPTR